MRSGPRMPLLGKIISMEEAEGFGLLELDHGPIVRFDVKHAAGPLEPGMRVRIEGADRGSPPGGRSEWPLEGATIAPVTPRDPNQLERAQKDFERLARSHDIDDALKKMDELPEDLF